MNALNKTLDLFTLAVALAFVAFGFCIAIDAFDLIYLEAKFRIMFGIIFMLYGVLRLATVIVKTVTRREV